jgi:hypothetical protein
MVTRFAFLEFLADEETNNRSFQLLSVNTLCKLRTFSVCYCIRPSSVKSKYYPRLIFLKEIKLTILCILILF